MHCYSSSIGSGSCQPYSRNPEEFFKELSRKYPDTQSLANSQMTFRPPSDLRTTSGLTEIPLDNNMASSFRFLNTVDGYTNAKIESPKASSKLQETIKFTTEFSNGIVNRTIKAVENAQVTSEGRNLQIELELSGLKLFDLEKKIDSCISSSRTALNLNSRLSPNVSTILSQSAAKEKLMKLQQDYTNITRGYCSISPQKSSSYNIKTSTSITDSMNIQDLTICMSPQDREKIITLDKKLSETKANCMISPVALAAKKYLENKENPYELVNGKSYLNLENKSGIATVKKPGALGKVIESQNSPLQVPTTPAELSEKIESEHSAKKNQREMLGRADRIMSASTRHEDKEFDVGTTSHGGAIRQDTLTHNRWISSANESAVKNECDSSSRMLNGEISFREDGRVEKNLFKEHFAVSPVLKSLSDASAVVKESLIEKPLTSQPSSEILIVETQSKDEKEKMQVPPLKTWTFGALETNYTHNSIPTHSGRVQGLRESLGGSSSGNEKLNIQEDCIISNDSDKKVFESLTEAWKSGASKTQELIKEKKYTDKPRGNLRFERPRENIAGNQYTRQNKSYESASKPNKKNYSEQSLQLKNHIVDSAEKYISKSECNGTKREWRDDSSIRVESEPTSCVENSVEREIHNFLSKFDSEEKRGQAREWLKKIIDGDKDPNKSLELYLQSEKERKKTNYSHMNLSHSDSGNSGQKKPALGRAQSSTKIQKVPSYGCLQKEYGAKTTYSNKEALNYPKKKEVTMTQSQTKLNSSLSRTLGIQRPESPGLAKIKNTAKIGCKSQVLPETEEVSMKPKASSLNGFTRKKLDSSSTSGLSQEELKKISDRMNKAETSTMARNLEYLAFLRKDVVRSINYIEKSIQDLDVPAEDTSLEGKSV